jgi:hypothetical protein
MKKTKLLFVVGLVVLIGAIFVIEGCSTTPKIPPELIVQPDPNNPYQGTWLSVGNQNMMYVIEDNIATFYIFSRVYGVPVWSNKGVYSIDDTWKINENGNILTVINTIYNRYK